MAYKARQKHLRDADRPLIHAAQASSRHDRKGVTAIVLAGVR